MEKRSYRQTARLHRLLSRPARLQILDGLWRDEVWVCHQQAVLGRPQVYVSQQLRVLREAGVIESHREVPSSFTT